LIHSLRWQLFLSLLLVIAVTVGMTAFLASRAATAEIERVQGRDNDARTERLRTLLARQYIQNRGWFDVQRTLEEAGEIYGQRVVLTNRDGLVVADSHRFLVGRHVDPAISAGSRLAVLSAEGRLGTLFINPELPSGLPSGLSPGQQRGSPSLTLSLVLSGLLAGGVAMALTFFLSRRILAPVESLSRVARLVARRDFSARAKVQSRNEVGELSRTFNSMAEELSRTEEVRRNLVADVAHELRTPVTNIRGYIEGISDGVMAADAATLASMHEEVLLLTRLIEDLQELALAESGRIMLQRQPCDLGDLARRAVTAVQQSASAKQVELEVDTPPAVPLEADPARISQVLRNLLVNAVTYTPSGGKIWVRVDSYDGQARVLVKDTGPGIPAEHLPHIFERFYRVDKSRSRATGGVGLGLTIARHLVEAHRGRIEAFSEVGKGSEFTVTLPQT
jgi:signal transduction histidine kinase